MSAPEIQIQLVDNAEPLLAYAKVPLTLYNKNHVIVELKVLNGERGPWIALPQRKEGDGWVEIIQVPQDIWQKVKYAVLLAYNTARHSQSTSKIVAKTLAKPVEQKEVKQSTSIPKAFGISKNKQEQIPIEQLPVSELIKLQPKRRIHLHDRQERIAFLERKYGKTYRGKPIKFMTNRQLYAISKKCGYR